MAVLQEVLSCRIVRNRPSSSTSGPNLMPLKNFASHYVEQLSSDLEQAPSQYPKTLNFANLYPSQQYNLMQFLPNLIQSQPALSSNHEKPSL